MKKLSVLVAIFLIVVLAMPNKVYATEVEQPTTVAATEAATTDTGSDSSISIGISTGDGGDMASVLKMLLVLTVLALAPSIIIMLTSFTRIISKAICCSRSQPSTRNIYVIT